MCSAYLLLIYISNTPHYIRYLLSSVGDPDTDPQVFEPPGSESFSQRDGSGSSLFSLRCLEKNLIFKTEDNVPEGKL